MVASFINNMNSGYNKKAKNTISVMWETGELSIQNIKRSDVAYL